MGETSTVSHLGAMIMLRPVLPHFASNMLGREMKPAWTTDLAIDTIGTSDVDNRMVRAGIMVMACGFLDFREDTPTYIDLQMTYGKPPSESLKQAQDDDTFDKFNDFQVFNSVVRLFSESAKQRPEPTVPTMVLEKWTPDEL